MSTREPDRCLDAEKLAAWMDGGLSRADAAAAEAHLSECPRCQSVVAALVRATPETRAAEPWWRRRWVVGSLVPLTAGAIAIAIWIAAPNEPPRPAAAPDRAAATEASQPMAAPRPEPPALVDRIQPAPTAAPRAAEDKAEERAPSRRREAKKEKADVARRDDQAATPAAPPPIGRVAAAEVAPMNEAVAKLQHVPSVEITSPDPAIRWRIGASGLIQYSANAGATWETLSSGVTEDLSAGAAPSPTVCWIVGRGGTVLLTSDGRRWQRLSFPAPTDLVRVQASDARAATVRTADGRTFRTADGGRTWYPLQEF